MMASIPRPKLIQLLGDGLVRIPIVTILGPRQGGKTTLAKEFCKARRDVVFLDLENPADAARLAEPMLYLERLSGLVLLDEVQTVPAVLNVLRVLADRRPLPLRFLLLGSASPELMDNASESLAGRVEFLEMGGFGLREAEGDQDRLWWRGGFPRAFLASKDEDARVWQQDFISTFLERDLRKMGIEISPAALRRLWTVCAHYHGQVWNSSAVAGGIGESARTVKRHLDVLSGAFMLRQLQPWHENLMKRQVKFPKVYLRDSGILHAMLGIPSLDALFSHPKLGASWEGFVIEQICRTVPRSQAFFWATHTGADVDLLLLQQGRRIGFECKVMDTPKATKSMHMALNDLSLDELLVVVPRSGEYPISQKIRVCGVGEAVAALRQ